MNKKIFAAGLCLVLIACALGGWYYFNHNNNNSDNHDDRSGKEVLLGKTPHCYQCTFGEDFVLYKDYVLKNDEEVFCGLYRYNLNDNKDSGARSKLLSDSYYICANVYRNKVIFISEGFIGEGCKIQQVDMENNNSEILYDNNGKAITDALIVDDYLYFIAENGEGVCNLLAINLTNNTQKQLIENISPHYLYHFGEGVAVKTRDNEILVKCGFEDGVIEKYSLPEDEILGFFEDGSILLVANLDTIYQVKDFNAGKKTVLMEKENIYRIIMHTDEMLVCTLDDYGLMEVYIYDFVGKNATKIANANAEPRDFNKEYIICGNDGIGMPELINRNTGEFENIVTNDTKGKTGEGKEEVSRGTMKEGDYKNAISDDELNDLLQVITEYYQSKLSWEVVDYRIADNGHSLYQQHKDYELGNIIVFEVHTTSNPSGLYRAIVLARKKNDAKWEVINEGI